MDADALCRTWRLAALRAAMAAPGSVAQRRDAGLDAARRALLAATEQGEARLALAVLGARQARGALPRGETPQLTEWLEHALQAADDLRALRRACAPAASMPLRERFERRLRSSVLAVYARCSYRASRSAWAGGDHGTSVEIGPAACSGSSSRVWSRNGKWSGSESSHKLVVPFGWLTRVQRRGLAVFDGMLTLDAHPVTAGLRRGEEAVLLARAAQGRGFELRLVEAVAYRRRGGAWIVGRSLAAVRRAAGPELRSATGPEVLGRSACDVQPTEGAP